MNQVTRRRFLSISAGLGCLAGLPALAATGFHEWRGVALGADSCIRLAHPQAEALVDKALAEIARLEDVFSLYRPHSALSQLNAAGRLDAPPFELLDVLAQSRQWHAVTGGAFDPTVQSLWQTYAEAWSAASAPSAAAIAAAQSRTGMHRVRLSEAEIVLEPGTRLTLNGIAQGYVADRVAALLRSAGATDVLIDTGEIMAMGRMPDGAAWPIRIAEGPRLALRDQALATSAPLGTCLDPAGTVGHILDPRTGLPAAAGWSQISVTARSAALADAASTAACLARDRQEIEAWFAAFPSAGLGLAWLA